jgi:protein TonB
MTDVAQLLESRRARVARWTWAALVVCALHISGVSLALMRQPEDNFWDDPAGGLAVDMTFLPAPMPVDSDRIAEGPEQEHGKETAEAAKEVVKKVQKDLPLVGPSRAPDPEIVLPKQKPDEKEHPKEETREVAKKQVTEDGQEVPTAPPRVEAQPAPSSAKSEGQSASIARAKEIWTRDVVRQLNRLKRVPEAARVRRGRWNVVVGFTLDASGNVLGVQIVQGSGIPVLDQEAEALIKRVRFPPPPNIEELYYTLPIVFGVD